MPANILTVTSKGIYSSIIYIVYVALIEKAATSGAKKGLIDIKTQTCANSSR